MKIIHQSGISFGVRHVKENQDVSLFEQFVAEGNEKADELAKEGSMLDGREMAQIRAAAVQQGSMEVYVAYQCAACFRSLANEQHDCEEWKPKPKEKLRFVKKT